MGISASWRVELKSSVETDRNERKSHLERYRGSIQSGCVKFLNGNPKKQNTVTFQSYLASRRISLVHLI